MNNKYLRADGTWVERNGRPDYMSEEDYAHWHIVTLSSMYWETRMWHPVLVGQQHQLSHAGLWLSEFGERGTPEARNDWLHPSGRLFLIREELLAVKFKLQWG